MVCRKNPVDDDIDDEDDDDDNNRWVNNNDNNETVRFQTQQQIIPAKAFL